jgi:hypothetical protein
MFMPMSFWLKRYGLLAWTIAVLLSLSVVGVASGSDVPLKPTAAAPAKASGVAAFQQGGAGATLVATLRGLGPGSYTLDVIRKSDGSIVTLGTIVVTDPTAGPDREANDDVKEPGSEQSEDLKVQTSVGLPPGLAPANIAQIRVKSAGGAVLLSGRLDAPKPPAPTSK